MERTLKDLIKDRLPALVWAYRGMKNVGNRILWFKRRNWSLKEVFEDAYKGMRCLESASGGGSTLSVTAAIREEIPRILKRFGVRTLVDAPCGDFHWMKEVSVDLEMYYGCDIVPELIERNKREYETARRKFGLYDITRDPLPRGDLILCRDCFVHLSYANIFSAIGNFKSSGATYLMSTTFPTTKRNRDIVTGDWRPIDLCKEPFRFPEPIILINEKYRGEDGRYADKSLGLWELGTIGVPGPESGRI